MKASEMKPLIRQDLNEMSKKDLKQASKCIKETVALWKVFLNSRRIGFYLAMNDEVSVNFLFDSGKDVYLPRYNQKSSTYDMALVDCQENLCAGQFGIKEPSQECSIAKKNEIDLWFVPAVAFDFSGNRLGRGGGFYDRLLKGEAGIKTGVAVSERILNDIPTESWDVKMDFILTDKEVISINER